MTRAEHKRLKQKGKKNRGSGDAGKQIVVALLATGLHGFTGVVPAGLPGRNHNVTVREAASGKSTFCESGRFQAFR